MSEYYRGKRSRNLFDPKAEEPFRLSRSKLELFLQCPRCFYLDRRLGVGQPPGFPFNLNSAVDHLLKKEFDAHRAKGEPHPLMSAYGLKAIPFQHPKLNEWRENFVGIQFHHRPTNLIITGAVDDVWFNEREELHVVDYKATAKDSEVNLDAEWQRGYKNQVEIYQWLLRQNSFKVSDRAYFVYANGRRDAAAFDARLEFEVKIIPYDGDDAWVEGKIVEAKNCLMARDLPASGPDCDFCTYRAAAAKLESPQLPML